MANEAKSSREWTDEELDLIVADYFDMLRAEQAGEPYIKARHREALLRRVDRTKRSIEFKHMNISAVLQELGVPWIAGYAPMEHYQQSIFGALDRYISTHPYVLTPEHGSMSLSSTVEPFIEAPPTLGKKIRPEPLERLIRKFDPVERDFRNRQLGHAGEQFVFELERRRLTSADRADLAKKVRWVSQEDGDGAGFDILSFDHSGSERLLEVKTTCGGSTTPFYLTRNEQDVSHERPNEFRLYRLYSFARNPRIFELRPPLEDSVFLDPLVFTASFR